MKCFCCVDIMNENITAKLSAVVAFSIFLHILYHIALIADCSEMICSVVYKVSKMGWIGSDFILCVAGYYCMQVYTPYSNKENLGWLATTVKQFVWIVPSYYLMLLLYLTVGLKIQHSLGYSFEFNQSYLTPLLLFYSNFNFARGPWTGVALEGAFLLSMVVQLFVFWGAFIAIVGKTRLLPWIIAGFWGLAIALRFLHVQDWHWFSYFNTFTRMDSFWAGVLLAYLKSNAVYGRVLEMKSIFILLVSGILFIVGVLFTGGMNVSNSYINYIAFPILAIFSFGALNWLLEYPGKFSVRFIRNNKFVFAVYLMKLPLIYMSLAIAKKIVDGSSELLLNATFIVISFVLCILFGLFWRFCSEIMGRVVLKKSYL